jgi:hypothetical protein
MSSFQRKFQVSADLLWGYNTLIDLGKDVTCIDEIVPLCLKRMRAFLVNHNLLALVDKVDTMELHHHFPPTWQSIEDVATNTSLEDVIYLCDHCHKPKAD